LDLGQHLRFTAKDDVAARVRGCEHGDVILQKFAGSQPELTAGGRAFVVGISCDSAPLAVLFATLAAERRVARLGLFGDLIAVQADLSASGIRVKVPGRVRAGRVARADAEVVLLIDIGPISAREDLFSVDEEGVTSRSVVTADPVPPEIRYDELVTTIPRDADLVTPIRIRWKIEIISGLPPLINVLKKESPSEFRSALPVELEIDRDRHTTQTGRG